MNPISAIKRTLRGEVRTSTAALEAVRRMNVSLLRRRERAQLEQLNRQPARLTPEFARISRAELLAHFRERQSPEFLPGFIDAKNTARLQSEKFPEETNELIAQAERIANDHCWPLLGFGEKCFGEGEINWNRDPLSGYEWPLDYHADTNLFRGDGSDARVLWELNRLSHFITLGRTYALVSEARPPGRASLDGESFSQEFLRQVRSWRAQNPVARGANWACAMEVALRAINLLAAFSLFLPSPHLDEDALAELLMIFDQHGAHIRRNLEYSHIATSNHYMCDVAGLLWLGIMLPELQDASEWREFGLRELLNEVDKQILPDGADSESSTGYHRLKLELLLYSFVLCRTNDINIEERYWERLRAMAGYTRAYLRPDGRAPLIGDSDSGQILPIVKRTGDDHAYVLDIVDALGTQVSGMLSGEGAHTELERHAGGVRTQAFPDAGIYILRDDDLYLLLNASGCGLNGRGSHGHNDALSIEVSAGGSAFIIDPGSYVYTADLHERHLFRSTAYHSTVQVDGIEQNTTEEAMPFAIGDEAHPRVLKWETNDEFDEVVAEHNGYRRLDKPVTHRRSIRFDKSARYWLIEDSFSGAGAHDFAFRFHCAPRIDVQVSPDGNLQLCDKINGACLLIVPLTESGRPVLESGFVSTDYGRKESSIIVCWQERGSVSLRKSWALIPSSASDKESRVNTLIALLRAGTGNKI
jgi:Heparinase II/III-like protein/Heparinase II/III N-terminus